MARMKPQEYAFIFHVGEDSFYFSYACEEMVIPVGEQDYETFYPYIQDVDIPFGEIDENGQSSIPTVSSSLWDPFDNFRSSVEEQDLNYQHVEIEIYEIDKTENGDPRFLGDSLFEGYMTSVSYKDSTISFEVRMKQDGFLDENQIDHFSFDSFQRHITKKPANDAKGYNTEKNTPIIEPVWLAASNMNWKMAEGYETASDVPDGNKDENKGGNTHGYAQSKAYVFADFETNPLDASSDPNSFTMFNLDQNFRKTGWDNSRANYYYDPDEEALIQERVSPFFDNSDKNYLAIGFPGTSNYEVVGYEGVVKNSGGDHIQFEGIPNTGPASVKFDHTQIEPVRPVSYDQTGYRPIIHDRVWIQTNGNLPTKLDGTLQNDPELDVGFLQIGGRLAYYEYDNNPTTITQHPAFLNAVPFFRYEILNVEQDAQLIQVLIHNDPAHEYHFNYPPSLLPLPYFAHSDFEDQNGNGIVANDLDEAGSLYYTRLRWYLKKLFIHVDNFYDPNSKMETANAWRGVRVDMLEDTRQEDVVQPNSLDFNDEDNYKQIDKSLFNSATGKFALARRATQYNVNSEVREIHIEFNMKDYKNENGHVAVDSSGNAVLYVDNDVDAFAVEDESDPSPDATDEEEEPIYPNLLYYDPDYDSLNDLENDSQSQKLKAQNAYNYFMNQTYRVILNEIPKHRRHLGEMFPIVYGNVDKVPIYHTISKSVGSRGESQFDDTTAGDDYYVYASHPTDVDHELDIEIYYQQEDQNAKSTDSDNGPQEVATRPIELYSGIAENPFPKVKNNHQIRVPIGGNRGFRIRGGEQIVSPYYELLNRKTLDGFNVYGIQLLGDRWDPVVGRGDARYPIRYGMGKTQLYASFGGWKSKGNVDTPSGDVIQHPLNIIDHYAQHYLKSNIDLIDRNSLTKVRSQTPKYQASVYLDNEDDAKFMSFLNQMCKEFGYYWYFHNGEIHFSLGEGGPLDRSKRLEKGLNIVGQPTLEVHGYNDIYTAVKYEYKKNWIRQDTSGSEADKYEYSIEYNKYNNELADRAADVQSQENVFKVQADFVDDKYTAEDVALRYLKRVVRPYDIYSVEADREYFEFQQGDYIPMRDESLSIDGNVMIRSVEYDDDIQTLKVQHFKD